MPTTCQAYRFMRFNLHIHSNRPAIQAAVSTSFGGWPGLEPDSQADMQLYLHQIDAASPNPFAKPNYQQAEHLIWQSSGPQANLLVDTQQGLAYGYFDAQVLSDAPFFRWHFLELAAYAMLAPRGIMGLHGAAIAKEGQAILLRAESGGGKTTLAYAATRLGWQALAEDVVWLDWAAKCWWGMPWYFHLLPDAKTLFSELRAYQPVLQTNQEYKLEVNLNAVYPDGTTTQAKPGPVVLVKRAVGQKSRLYPIPFEAALPQFLRGQAGAESEFANYAQRLETLLCQNTYQLEFGDDIDAAVALLEPLVAGAE